MNAVSCRLPLAFFVASIVACCAAPAWATWPTDNLKVCPAELTRQNSASVSDGSGGQIVVSEEDYRGHVDLYIQRLGPTGAQQWGGGNGVALCTASGDQRFPSIVSDGSGGAIIAWQDTRGASDDIYVQRVSSSGAPQWTANGVALCTAINNQFFPVIASDGAGGAIVAWMDGRSSSFDVYCRRINSAGTPQWAVDGVALCTQAGTQSGVVIAADGSGGAVVAWQDARAGNLDIYARRINSAGTPQWTADGVALCTQPGDQDGPSLVADGTGGAIVAWRDLRGGVNTDVYAARVTNTGFVPWAADGIVLCNAAGDQGFPMAIADGSGGAVVAWDDGRGAALDIYAQRVSNAGAIQWAANGVVVCSAADTQTGPTLLTDGSGGAIIAWRDRRSGDYDLYAQRVSGAGAAMWTANGVPVCVIAGNAIGTGVVPDGFGGAFLTWDDSRAAEDTYAQRIDNTGAPAWAANGVRAFLATDQRQNPAIVGDGSSGAIIVWEETYRGNSDLYAQHVDGTGAELWAADGVAVSTAAGSQSVPAAVSDGAGGVIVAWGDSRNAPDPSDIYAQRLNASGVPQWTANGVALCTATDFQLQPKIVTDGAGGAVVAWGDDRSGASDIYARRITSAGVPQWTVDGVALCTATGNQYLRDITSDGAGGAILVWEDNRGSDSDIYARRITVAGVPQWTLNGVALCTATGDQIEPRLATDGAGGAIVAWDDDRSPPRMVYARRITSAGAPQWAADGVAVCAFPSFRPGIVSDGVGGAIIAWSDLRSNVSYDIYTQRLNGSGLNQWTPSGVALSTAPELQAGPLGVTDGSNGALFVWLDDRYDPVNQNEDLFSRRITAAGVPQGLADGAPVVVQPGRQVGPVIVADGLGGAILAWQDGRGIGFDVYAHRIGPSGSTVAVPAAPVTASFGLGPAWPNPMRDVVELHLRLPERAAVRLDVFDLHGRHVRQVLAATLGAGETAARWDGRDDAGRPTRSGVYLCRLEAEGHVAVSRIARAE